MSWPPGWSLVDDGSPSSTKGRRLGTRRPVVLLLTLWTTLSTRSSACRAQAGAGEAWGDSAGRADPAGAPPAGPGAGTEPAGEGPPGPGPLAWASFGIAPSLPS